MFLALDIGNTNIKCAFFRGNKITRFDSFHEIDAFINHLENNKFDSAGISSVVPSMNKALSARIKKISGIRPYIISRDSPFGIKLNYKTADTLGIDRICAVEGACSEISFKFPEFNENRNYAVVIDFGTATTLNIIKMPSEFTGGMILPGVELMFDALQEHTAQLPIAAAQDYKSLIGKSTKSSIASGIINANAGLIEKVVNELKHSEKAKEVKIFITGGNASKLIKHFGFSFIHEKALVLKGVNSVCRRVSGFS